MAAIDLEAGSSVKVSSGIARVLVSVSCAAALMVALASPASAAETADHIVPPTAAEVAMLRNLLALQHPTLRQAGAAVPTPAVAPVPAQPVGAEPLGTTDGEVAAPAAADPVRTARLSGEFRASLQRAVAVAGLHRERL